MLLDSLYLLTILLLIISIIIPIIINKIKNKNTLKYITKYLLIINIIIFIFLILSYSILNIDFEILIFYIISLISIVIFVVDNIILINKKSELKPNKLISNIIILVPIIILLFPLIIELKLIKNFDYYIVYHDNNFFPNFYNYIMINNKEYKTSFDEKIIKGKYKNIDLLFEENDIITKNNINEFNNKYINEVYKEIKEKLKEGLDEEEVEEDEDDITLSSYKDGEVITVQYCDNNCHNDIYYKGKLIYKNGDYEYNTLIIRK